MRRRVLTIITSLALAASACGGGSDEPEATQALAAPQTPVPAPTTTSPPPTTTAAPAPTTAAPPATTTTTAVPLPDGQELLMMTNEAMAQMPEFLGTGRGVVKEAIDAPDSAALVTQLAVGGGPAGGGGDFWQLTLVNFNTPSLQDSFLVQQRTVDGVDYDQDPETGAWEIDSVTDPDPVEDVFAGRLELSDIIVQTGPGGYTLIGSYPADDNVDAVVLEVLADSGLLLSVTVFSHGPRREFAGLVPLDGDDLIVNQQIDVTTYAVEIAPIVAPPLDIPMVLIPNPDAPFKTLIPTDWEQFPLDELDAAGFTDGYLAPNGLGLFVLVEDLAGTGITSLGGYADAVSFVLSEFELSRFDAISTLQGGFVWIIDGIDPSDGSAFRRLLYVTPDLIAVNLTFVQGLDPETGELTTAWENSQALIDFMLNSFVVDS